MNRVGNNPPAKFLLEVIASENVQDELLDNFEDEWFFDWILGRYFGQIFTEFLFLSYSVSVQSFFRFWPYFDAF